MDATDRARQAFTGFPPSSPSIALLQDGKLLYMIERRDIEVRSATDDRRHVDDGVRQVSARRQIVGNR